MLFLNLSKKCGRQEKNITSYGHYRFLGYNPPYQLFGRRNEIIVSVEWKEK
jgi:hypothetical protein